MVSAFAHVAMGLRIDPSWWTHGAIFRFCQCSTTGVTKTVVWSVGWYSEKVAHVAAAGFLSCYLNGVLRHITVNKMC